MMNFNCPHGADLRDNVCGICSEGRAMSPPPFCLARTASDELLTRCDQYPKCPCGGPGPDVVRFEFPRAWAPYLQAVILGSVNDFESDCRWHLNELQKQLGEASNV